MILFSNAKINLGLFVTEKRKDNFHNIETVFYPIRLYDLLEFKESSKFELDIEGIKLDIDYKKNLIYKVYKKFKKEYDIPPVKVYMIKRIPAGAGLGGGSSNATFFAKSLNDYFSIGMSKNDLASFVLDFGSDCPFFVENSPVFAVGRGEIMNKIDLHLKDYKILIVKPNIFISTKEAYSNVKPFKRDFLLKNIVLNKKVLEWKDYIVNDFDSYVEKKYPVIKEIKEKLYNEGALFASMTGSGSAVYGIFEKKIKLNIALFKQKYQFVWKGDL